MFSINVMLDDGRIQFTIVRPDTTYCSGSRASLDEVYTLVKKEIQTWTDRENRRKGKTSG